MRKIETLVNGFPAVCVPNSNYLLRVGVTLFTLSRISGFYNIKIKDGRTVDTFPNIYFLFFGGSGEGKGKVLKSLEGLPAFNEFLTVEKQELEAFEKAEIKRLSEEYMKKFSVGEVFDDIGDQYEEAGGKEDKAEKKKAVTYARGKHKNIQPYMSDSTRPNLESTALAVCRHNRIGVSLKNDEFLIWMKRKKSDSFELFEFMAEVYDNGDVVMKGTNAANRGVNESQARGFPLNVIFFSSEYLMRDSGVNGLLKDFFVTAGARRFLTASGEELDEPMYTEEEIESMYEEAKSEANQLMRNFAFGCKTHADTGLFLTDEARDLFNQCKQKSDNLVKNNARMSDLSKIEIKGGAWRALKISGLLAILNHPESNEITYNDYKEAWELNKMFINSFKGIVDRNWVDEIDRFIDFIKKNQGCKKGDLYKLDFFSSNKNYFNQKYNEFVEVAQDILDKEDKKLVIDDGIDGKSKVHSIVDKPKDFIYSDEFKYLLSISKDMAKGYRSKKLTTEQVVQIMENDKGFNYSAGEFADSHRMQKNWQGGNNCLVLDIDNDEDELTIADFKAIFEGYRYLIQPTKSHLKDKGEKGVKERFRVVFPTSEMPKMPVDRFRRIYDNFHKAFGIEKFGDVKASGDTARFFYASPHKAEVVEGSKMINWRKYDFEVTEESKTIEKQYFGAGNIDEGLKQYEGLAVGEKIRIHCPFGTHEDKNKSAFVSRKDQNAVYATCSSCGVTKFSN